MGMNDADFRGLMAQVHQTRDAITRVRLSAASARDQIETRAALALGIHPLPADDLPPGLGARIADRVAFQLACIAEESK